MAAQNFATGSGSDLDKLQTKAALLSAQLEVAKLEKKIQDIKNGTSGEAANPANTLSKMAIPARPAPFVETPSTPMPSVLMISGVSGNYTARIRLPSGGIVTAHDGQTLSKGVRVIRISGEGVLMAVNGKTKTIYVDGNNESQGMVNKGGYPAVQTPYPYYLAPNNINPAMAQGQPLGALEPKH
jgi:type IV pilus biogenesis protein PilP